MLEKHIRLAVPWILVRGYAVASIQLSVNVGKPCPGCAHSWAPGLNVRGIANAHCCHIVDGAQNPQTTL